MYLEQSFTLPFILNLRIFRIIITTLLFQSFIKRSIIAGSLLQFGVFVPNQVSAGLGPRILFGRIENLAVPVFSTYQR